MSLSFALSYARRSLRRDTQRTTLAIICIAFGVMVLTALQVPAALLSDLLARSPRERLGADAMLTRGGRPLTATEIGELDRVRAKRHIGGYSVLADGSTPMISPFRLPGKTGFVTRPPLIVAGHGNAATQLKQAMGVDPATYPLVGTVKLRGGAGLPTVLGNANTVVVTADLVDRLQIDVGDAVTITGIPGRAPSHLTVTGIAIDTPDGRSSSMLYNLETAQRIMQRQDVVTGVLVTGGSRDIYAQFTQAGWQVQTPDEVRRSGENGTRTITFIFKGAGILGLILGGIGAANTLQVLWARRSLELATLKALGYHRRQLLTLFSVELALLGSVSSVLGVLAAVPPSIIVTTLFGRLVPSLVSWQFHPAVFVRGLLIGFVTTLVMGLYTVVRAGDVRPAILLRHLPDETTRVRTRVYPLLSVLAVSFIAISSAIMGSLIGGIGVLVGAAAVLGLLGTLCAASLTLLSRIPAADRPFLLLAQRNIARQGRRAIVALLALVIGVFAIGLAAAAIYGARNQSTQASDRREQLLVVTDRSQRVQVTALVDRQGVRTTAIEEVAIRGRTSDGTVLPWATVVQGYATAARPAEVQVSGVPWGSDRTGVYVPHGADFLAPSALAPSSPGRTIHVTTRNGQQHELRVVGTYRSTADWNGLWQPQGLLASQQLVQQLGDSTTTLIVMAPEDELKSLEAAVRRAIPDVTTVWSDEVNARWRRFASDMLALVVSVAGLALLAGAVLVANAVALAMLERRRELGVWKALGFTAQELLGMIALEYGLLGLTAGLLGMVSVATAAYVVRLVDATVQIAVQPLLAALLIIAAVLLALGSSIVVAWRPTQMRPLEVLRNE